MLYNIDIDIILYNIDEKPLRNIVEKPLRN